MDDPKDSPLRKAEDSAKRALERLGSAIDKKVMGRSRSEFGADYAGDLASRIERALESSLKSDSTEKPRIAPNHFKVGLTYEEASKLTRQQIESLSQDLTAAAHEFIHNRRYQTEGPVQVEVVSDLFATATTVKTEFDREGSQGSGGSDSSAPRGKTAGADSDAKIGVESGMERPGPAAPTGEPGDSATHKRGLTLLTEDGREWRLDLIRGGAPQYIGRAAGNAVRLDDPSISRVHCSIALRSDGQLVISDLESANGTFVNGQDVNTGEATKLDLGDMSHVGDVTLKVCASQ